MSRDEKILICTPVAEQPKAFVPSRKKRCDICGCAVWVSRSSPKGATPRCQQCVALTIDPAAKIEPLSQRQSAEVTNWRKKHLS